MREPLKDRERLEHIMKAADKPSPERAKYKIVWEMG